MTVFSYTDNLMALKPNPPCQLSLWEETGVPGALTVLFSHKNWVRVHIKTNLTGD